MYDTLVYLVGASDFLSRREAILEAKFGPSAEGRLAEEAGCCASEDGCATCLAQEGRRAAGAEVGAREGEAERSAARSGTVSSRW